MRINISCVIGILLILIIIYILYRKKKNFSETFLTSELETQLSDVIVSCFTIDQEPQSVASFLTKEMINDPVIKEEIYKKLEELILPALYSLTKIFRIVTIDFYCGNSEGDTFFNYMVEYLLKCIKSVVIVFREILDISSNVTLQPLIFNDSELIQQIRCLRKKYLPYDDPKILNEYDLNNEQVDQTSSAYTFSTKLLEFSIKLASNTSTDECLNVDLTQDSNILSSYIYIDGSQRTCNSTTPLATTSSPTIAATSSPTVAATSSPTVAATSSPTVAVTSSPTVAATSSPTVAATSSPTVAATSSPTITVTSSPTVAATPSPTRTSLTSSPTVTATSSPTRPSLTSSPTVTATSSPTRPSLTSSPTITATSSPTVAVRSSIPTITATSSPTSSNSTTSPQNITSTLPLTSTSDTTVTGFDSSIFGTSYSDVIPSHNNIPPFINLINSQGPNNFFLPNIRIA